MNQRFLFPALFVTASVALIPNDASACGGCVYAPVVGGTQNPSVVTDHRMVLSVSADATTLWDQIEYAGDPEEFAWVLPIRGAVVVGLGSDAFIDALDKRTAPSIIGPTVRCKQPPPRTFGNDRGTSSDYGSDMSCGCGSASSDMEASPTDFAGSADSGAGFAPDEGVVVTERKAVGPYETVQIHGDDSESIITWLRKNNYEIPASIEPVLNKYTAEKFDFLAVRLKPGAGVHAMKPIRVSWKGATPMLPLRMVAAGVGDSVGIKLFVIGDGRWKTKNFATYTIANDDLVWDFATQRSNYTKLRSEKAGLQDMHAFALETSDDIVGGSLPTRDPDTGTGLNMDAGAPDSADAADGSDAADAIESDAIAEAAVEDAAAPVDAPPPYDAGDKPKIADDATDVDIAFGAKTIRRVTRLRADLPARHLNIDLELEADEDQSLVPPERRVLKQTGAEALCPLGVESVSLSTISSPLTNDKPTSGGTACNIGNDRKSPLKLPALAIFGLFGVALARGIRRRR